MSTEATEDQTVKKAAIATRNTEGLAMTQPKKNKMSEFSSEATEDERAQTMKLPKNRENDPTALDVILNLIN